MTVFDVDIDALPGGAARPDQIEVPPDDPGPVAAVEKPLPR